MIVEVKIKFLHKGSINKKVECEDNSTAIITALQTLNLTEKLNVTAVLIKDRNY
jgi:hypothetical protein